MLTATQLIHRISFFTLAGILPLACTVGGDGVDDVGDVGGRPSDSDSDVGWGGSGTAGASTGGATSTGGAGPTGGVGGGPSCESGVPAAPETYLCAGSAWEQTVLGHTWSHVEAQPAYYACGGSYYPEYPSTGGASGVGGSGTAGGWGEDGGSGEDDGWADDGGWGAHVGVGGEGGVGTGGFGTGGFGTGGFGTGGVGTGGSGGGTFSDWCDGVEPFTAIAGVTFRQGDCRLSDLKLPVRFQEPNGWYELRVYAGSTACERDLLLAETSGYGLGQIVELPVAVSGDTFVSIELTSDQGWADGLIELNSLAPPPAL